MSFGACTLYPGRRRVLALRQARRVGSAMNLQNLSYETCTLYTGLRE